MHAHMIIVAQVYTWTQDTHTATPIPVLRYSEQWTQIPYKQSMLAQTYIHTHIRNPKSKNSQQQPFRTPKTNQISNQTQNLKPNQETQNSHTHDLRRREGLGFGHGFDFEGEDHQ